jgi:hypothetical protein
MLTLGYNPTFSGGGRYAWEAVVFWVDIRMLPPTATSNC